MNEGNSERLEGAQRRSPVLPTQLLHYGVALLSVASALGVTLLLSPYLDSTPTPLFFAAVMVSAWYGGIRPGIVATVLSTLAINYFLLEPVRGLSEPNPGTLVRLGVFVMAALLINSLNESQRAARRRAEANLKSLRESEARFGCLAESNIIGMLVVDLNGAILEANHNFLQLVGYTREELRSGQMHWREMTAPESLEVSETAVQELLTTGACTPFEKEYIRKDGSRVCVLHGAVMTGDSTVTGFVLDLSERKQVEAIEQESIHRERSLHAQVQAANAQLKTVLTSLKDQFLVLDREWRYVYASDRVVEIVGIPREDLLGKCIWELFPETVNGQFYREMHRAVAEQKIVQFEYFYSPWQQWFENRVYPSAAGVSLLVTDITERKRAAEKLQRANQTLQTLLDACPVAIVFFDPQGIVQLWNRAAEQIFGWSAEEVIGQFMPTVPHRTEEFLASIQTVLSGRSLNGLEARHLRKDGQMVDLEIWANLTCDAEGNPGCLGIAWDITDRKQAEKALRESEARFQLLVSNMPGMVYRYAVDANGGTTFTYVSSGSRELVELEPEVILQDVNAFFGLIHPDDLPSFRESIAIAVNSSAAWQWEGRLTTPSEQLKWIQGRSRPQQIDYGQAWDGLFLDITERKQAQQELQQTLQTLQTVFAASPLPIVVIEPDLTVKLWNTAAEQLFGWSEAEILGQLIPIVPPEKQEEYRQFREAIARGEVFFGVETYRCKRDGSTVTVNISAAPLYDDHDSVNAFLLILQDVTAQQQAAANLQKSEERLRLALDAGSMGAWEWNLETSVQQWDVNQYNLFGMDKDKNQLSADAFFQFIHPDDLPHAQQLTEQVLEQGGSFHTEFRIITPDGNVRWLSSQGIVIQDCNNRPIRMIGVNFDITERKREEEERERLLANEQAARQEAEAANRIKDEFLAILSHELRSPLNPILGWSRLLQTKKMDDARTAQALATIERNAKLQTQLIDDLLDVSRILRGKLVLNIAPVSLVSVTEAALETVRLAIEAKGIQIQRAFNLDIDQVMGDAARLQQVVWNLLSNAVKFTPSGGTVEIRLEQFDDCAQIQVRDTGKGITLDFLPYVFDYFRQEDGTTTRKFGGLGLGLAIVRHITELHGGTVKAESPGEGLGATFTVQLPLMLTSVYVDQEDESAITTNLSGARILAVDDDADIRALLEFALEQAGAEVCVVASAPEALQQLKAFSPEVLVSDIGMPDCDGYMLMRQIRTLPPEQGGAIPAIALTAYAGEIDQQQAIAAGFQTHLAKPVEPERLIEAIIALLDQRSEKQ